jgi:uncharacterized protein (TIGR02145 family)
MTYLGGPTVAGGKIKEAGLVHWGPIANIGATNSYGFTALPAGSTINGVFVNLRQYTNIWTTTKGMLASDARYFGATYSSSANISGESTKTVGQTIRCVKN